jgi:hypothetical protein
LIFDIGKKAIPHAKAVAQGVKSVKSENGVKRESISIDAINRISIWDHTEKQRPRRNGFNRDGQDIQDGKLYKGYWKLENVTRVASRSSGYRW